MNTNNMNETLLQFGGLGLAAITIIAWAKYVFNHQKSMQKSNKETMDTVWGNFDFRVALTPDLIELWNQEAQWAKDTGKITEETAIPNFRNIIFSDSLKKVAPSAVEL